MMNGDAGVLRFLFVICAGFGLGAILCAIQYTLIRRGRFRRNPFLGVATSVTRESDDIWRRAHEAAAPWIMRAGMLAALASVIAGVGLAVGAEASAAYGIPIASGLVGAGAAAAFMIGADGAARREAKRRRR
jgi:hypothetical protein